MKLYILQDIQALIQASKQNNNNMANRNPRCTASVAKCFTAKAKVKVDRLLDTYVQLPKERFDGSDGKIATNHWSSFEMDRVFIEYKVKTTS